MSKKMFELNLFEEGTKDLLDTAIEEGTQEFETKCPSMNPEEHFDKDASGDRKVTADPAEKPTAKPADGEMGPVNAQTQTETPTAKPYDANSISIPGKATLTVDQYNQAITQLQKSFKEGAELLAALQEAEIVTESVDELQDQYLESAILDAYADGPMFESVDRSDKKELKKLVKSLRKPVIETLKKNGVKVSKDATGNGAEIMKAILLGAGLGIVVPADVRRNSASKAYQIICSVECNAKKKTHILGQLNKLYAEELGVYQIKAFAIRKSSDVNKTDEDEANRYLIYVDKKDDEDKEFEKAFTDVNNFIKKGDK